MTAPSGLAAILGKPCTCTMDSRNGDVLDREADCGIHGAAVVALAVSGWERAGGSWPDSISGRRVIMAAVDAGRAPLTDAVVEARAEAARARADTELLQRAVTRLARHVADHRCDDHPAACPLAQVRHLLDLRPERAEEAGAVEPVVADLRDRLASAGMWPELGILDRLLGALEANAAAVGAPS